MMVLGKNGAVMTANPSNKAPDEMPQAGSSFKLPLFFLGFMLVGFVMAALVVFANNNNLSTNTNNRPEASSGNGGGTVVGWQVPDFSLDTLDGETVSITDYRGKVVFLNFWATWCIPCQREMPAFNDFMAQGRDDAVILAVNNGEEIQPVAEFVNLFQLEHVPILMDSAFVVSDGFGVVNLPVTYVLDGEGVVRYFKLGEVTSEDIESYIAAIQEDV